MMDRPSPGHSDWSAWCVRNRMSFLAGPPRAFIEAYDRWCTDGKPYLEVPTILAPDEEIPVATRGSVGTSSSEWAAPQPGLREREWGRPQAGIQAIGTGPLPPEATTINSRPAVEPARIEAPPPLADMDPRLVQALAEVEA